MLRLARMADAAARHRDAPAGDGPRVALETIRAAQEGETDAFARLYRETFTDVARYVTAIVGDATQAEDAVAQVYMDAWRSLPALREPSRFESWLFRIAHNRALDLVRSRPFAQLEEAPEPPAPSSENPADELMRRERLLRLRAALLDLPEDQRQVVILRLLRGLSHAEIGEQTGRSEGASRVMLHRALQRLRLGLDADDEEPWRRIVSKGG